ncbi:MAG: MoaD/ThiS family protein [Syntrophobacteraceae bacterium]
MPVRLMLAASLRKYVSNYDGSTGHEMIAEPGSTVRDLARRLSIPEDEVKIIIVDGISARWDLPLTGDERVALFPAVGGG